jgi:hypothetical protein
VLSAFTFFHAMYQFGISDGANAHVPSVPIKHLQELWRATLDDINHDVGVKHIFEH